MAPVWILLLQLRLTAEEAAYTEKGHSRVLPCGLDQPFMGTDVLIWSYQGARDPVALFRAVMGQVPVQQAGAWERLVLLPNFSLQLQRAEDNDTGTYWCTVNNKNLHNYELAVVTGTHTALADPACQQFSCALSAPLAQSALTWWADGRQVQDTDEQGRLRLFWGPRAALLQACWAGTRPDQLRCQLKDMGVTFNLTGTAKDLPNPPRRGSACGSVWMPLATVAVLEFLLILTLGAALWKQRQPDQGLELGDSLGGPTLDPPGPKLQLYENVGLGWCPPPGTCPSPVSLPP